MANPLQNGQSSQKAISHRIQLNQTASLHKNCLLHELSTIHSKGAQSSLLPNRN